MLAAPASVSAAFMSLSICSDVLRLFSFIRHHLRDERTRTESNASKGYYGSTEDEGLIRNRGLFPSLPNVHIENLKRPAKTILQTLKPTEGEAAGINSNASPRKPNVSRTRQSDAVKLRSENLY